MYTHEVKQGIHLSLLKKPFNSTSYKGTVHLIKVQYWVESWISIIYCSFLYTFKAAGAMSQDRQGHYNFKRNIPYKTTSFQATMVKECVPFNELKVSCLFLSAHKYYCSY